MKRKKDWRKPPIGSVKASFPCILYKIYYWNVRFWFYSINKQNNKKVMRVKQLVYGFYREGSAPRFIYLFNFFLVLWFLCGWSLQRSHLNKSPCRCRKKTFKHPKELTNSINLNLTICPLISLIFIKRDTKSIFVWRFVKNWAIPEFIHEQTFWGFTEDVYKILHYKIRKTPYFSQICSRELSFSKRFE